MICEVLSQSLAVKYAKLIENGQKENYVRK